MAKRYFALILVLLVAVSVMIQPINAKASSSEINVYLGPEDIEYMVSYFTEHDEEGFSRQVVSAEGYHDLSSGYLTMYQGSISGVLSVRYSVIVRLPLSTSQLNSIASADTVQFIVSPKSVVGGSTIYSFYSWGDGTSYNGTTKSYNVSAQ